MTVINEIGENIRQRIANKGRDAVVAEMEQLQVAVYVMCNGGFLGRSASEQPESFYVDDRVKKLPYSRRQIVNAVRVLHVYQMELGFETMPRAKIDFHNCGVW
jgi:hypothetical protein